MDIYFNYCSDPYTGESATLVKCTRETFESGFVKAVELNKLNCMSTLGVYDSPQDVKESLLSDIRFYWGEIDKLNDYEFIEAVNNILDENSNLFDIIDFVVSDEPGDKIDEMVEVQ